MIKICEMCGEKYETIPEEAPFVRLCDECFEDSERSNDFDYEQHSDADPGL